MKIVVGMSGGVDSAVSAMLLKQAGHSVSGLFMKNWDEDDGTEYCTAATDLIDAEGICHRLGIELHTANFAREYWDNVFAHFLSEYRAGRTPNPDVLCNREIKFAVFAEHAVRLGADAIATGHYARLDHSQGQPVLVKGIDPGKDQSYFLHAVAPAQMANVQFPLGDLHKSAVRDIAKEHSLHVHDRKDSTGICFIGERRFSDFLARYLPAQPGLIEDEEGRVIGEHSGLMYYTIGQRQGLKIGGLAQRAELPWYAAAKDLNRNVLTVVQGNDHPLLFTDTLTVGQTNWWGAPPKDTLAAAAKVRYRQADQTCEITPLQPELASGTACLAPNGLTSPAEQQWQVRFAQPQRAVTPGQYAVFYDGDHCLGGGVIQ